MKPAYEMRISYWSSDVCSSDLSAENAAAKGREHRHGRDELPRGAIAKPRRFRHELVQRGIDIIGELDFRHRPQAIGAHAHRDAADAAFGDRPVQHAVLAIFPLQAPRGPDDAPQIPHLPPHPPPGAAPPPPHPPPPA